MDIRIYMLCIAIVLALIGLVFYIRKIELIKQLTEVNILTVDVPDPKFVSFDEIKQFVDKEHMSKLLKEYLKIIEKSQHDNFRTIAYIKNRISVLEGKEPEYDLYFNLNVPKQSLFNELNPY